MFDPSPAHITILLIVLVVLFGAARLPKAAKSLGQSMHIFKKEVQGLTSDGDSASAASPASPVTVTALPAAPAQDPTQQQLTDLQRQVEELQRQSAGSGNGQAGQTQTGQPL